VSTVKVRESEGGPGGGTGGLGYGPVMGLGPLRIAAASNGW
jgi:hypothetical protein